MREQRLSRSGVDRYVLIALGLQLLITIPLAYILNIWQDDAYTLHTTSRDLAYALRESIGFEQNPPLYFVVMTLWRGIDQSYFFARLFSVICAALSVILVPNLVKRYLPQFYVPWITLVIALNPFLIWAALEIRVYALVILISVVLLVLFHEAFLRPDPPVWAAVAYAVVSALGAYAQYYIVLLVAAQGVVLLLYRRKFFLRYVLAEVAALLAFAPMLAIVPTQAASARGALAAPTLLQTARVLAKILALYVLPLQRFPHSHQIYPIAGVLVCIGAIAAARFAGRHGRAMLPVMWIAAFALFTLVLYVERELVFTRHAAPLFILTIVSIFAMFTFLRPPAGDRTVIVWSCIAILVELSALFATYRGLAKPGDWEHVASFIQSHEQRGQPIMIFQAENALPFEYYYRGPNAVVPVPRPPDLDRFNVEEYVVHDGTQVTQALDRVPDPHETVWLVRAGECQAANIAFGCDVMDRYVAEHYTTVLTKQFYQSSVRLLVAKKPAG